MRSIQFEDRPANVPTGVALPGEDATFTAPDGRAVELSQLRGRPVVLVFNRGFSGFICPACTTYTAQLAERTPELRALGAEVIVVYPTPDENEEVVARFRAAVGELLAEEGLGALPFPVYLDRGLAAIRRFNLVGELARPSTFVLDAAGQVRYAYVGNGPADRPNLDRIANELRSLSGGQAE